MTRVLQTLLTAAHTLDSAVVVSTKFFTYSELDRVTCLLPNATLTSWTLIAGSGPRQPSCCRSSRASDTQVRGALFLLLKTRRLVGLLCVIDLSNTKAGGREQDRWACDSSINRSSSICVTSRLTGDRESSYRMR